MRLINKNKGTPFADVGAYVCELTDELDALAKTVSDASVNRHYILADEFCKRNKMPCNPYTRLHFGRNTLQPRQYCYRNRN